jgi:hypothetical protein
LAQKAETEKARSDKNEMRQMAGTAKQVLKGGGVSTAVSLFAQMKPLNDWMYFLAIMMAMLKDILDILTLSGVLYILVIVITFLTSIFIALMMILGEFSTGIGRQKQKMIRKWLVLLFGTTSEMIIGLNFLPITTLTVAIVYALVLLERKNAKVAGRR